MGKYWHLHLAYEKDAQPSLWLGEKNEDPCEPGMVTPAVEQEPIGIFIEYCCSEDSMLCNERYSEIPEKGKLKISFAGKRTVAFATVTPSDTE